MTVRLWRRGKFHPWGLCHHHTTPAGFYYSFYFFVHSRSKKHQIFHLRCIGEINNGSLLIFFFFAALLVSPPIYCTSKFHHRWKKSFHHESFCIVGRYFVTFPLWYICLFLLSSSMVLQSTLFILFLILGLLSRFSLMVYMVLGLTWITHLHDLTFLMGGTLL